MNADSPDGVSKRTAWRAPLVLVVDDDERNRRLVRDVLHGAEIRTLEAANGSEAISAASDHLPDLVLLDLQLPDIDGWEVARQLAAGERTSAIPLVALSATRHPAGGAWLAEAGFAASIEKPIDVVEFPTQVRRLLEPGAG